MYRCGLERCSHDPSLYSKCVHKDGTISPATSESSTSRVSWGTYVDDWRQRFDPDEASREEAKRDRERLEKRFGIEFKEEDPKTDYSSLAQTAYL